MVIRNGCWGRHGAHRLHDVELESNFWDHRKTKCNIVSDLQIITSGERASTFAWLEPCKETLFMTQRWFSSTECGRSDAELHDIMRVHILCYPERLKSVKSFCARRTEPLIHQQKKMTKEAGASCISSCLKQNSNAHPSCTVRLEEPNMSIIKK